MQMTEWERNHLIEEFHVGPIMHEDELPADITAIEYSEWYKKSFIPGGVGVRVGPVVGLTMTEID